jgi:hypothetical protein
MGPSVQVLLRICNEIVVLQCGHYQLAIITMPTSMTVVQPDGTIWTTGQFTQVTPPAT